MLIFLYATVAGLQCISMLVALSSCKVLVFVVLCKFFAAFLKKQSICIFIFQGHAGNGIDVQVQFNFSVTMKCDSSTTLDGLRRNITQQAIPKSVAMM